MPTALTRTEEKVHIDAADGTPLFNRLYRTSSPLVFDFEGGFGFIDALDVERYGWVVKEGWRK